MNKLKAKQTSNLAQRDITKFLIKKPNKTEVDQISKHKTVIESLRSGKSFEFKKLTKNAYNA
jgi:hypothetical protein